MKKLFLALVAVFMFGAASAQTGLGVNGGVLMAMPAGDLDGDSELGFYAGVFKQFPLGEGFQLQPALNMAIIDGDFGLQIPVIFKYYVADGFNLQAGPQFLFDFEEAPDDWTNFNIGLGIGAGYDFSERFLAELRYGLQLNNHYTGDADLSAKVNYMNIGVGYKF